MTICKTFLLGNSPALVCTARFGESLLALLSRLFGICCPGGLAMLGGGTSICPDGYCDVSGHLSYKIR